MHRVCCCCNGDTTTCEQCTGDDAMPSTVVVTIGAGSPITVFHAAEPVDVMDAQMRLGYICTPPNSTEDLGFDEDMLGSVFEFPATPITLSYCQCLYSSGFKYFYGGFRFIASWSWNGCCETYASPSVWGDTTRTFNLYAYIYLRCTHNNPTVPNCAVPRELVMKTAVVEWRDKLAMCGESGTGYVWDHNPSEEELLAASDSDPLRQLNVCLVKGINKLSPAVNGASHQWTHTGTSLCDPTGVYTYTSGPGADVALTVS